MKKAERNFYGRIKGKKFRPKQEERMQEILPKIKITLSPDGKLDPQELFQNENLIWLEIGFGGGEHLAHMAKTHQDVNFIGSEPYLNGVASALRHIDEGNIHNIRIFPDDVRALFDQMPDNSLSRAYLLYPDPWPKLRHKERRFMHSDNMSELSRLLKSGSELRVASDIEDYINHSLEIMDNQPNFTRINHDISTPWEGWFRTRYEAKAIRENRSPHYLRFQNHA